MENTARVAGEIRRPRIFGMRVCAREWSCVAPRCTRWFRALESQAAFSRCDIMAAWTFLEAIDRAVPGSILVVDNAGRRDEACIGDLVTLEAARAGLGGIVIWGCHRDTVEIRSLGLPLFSLGAFAAGPTRLDPRTEDAFSSATIGDFSVSAADIVVADDDGALFIPTAVIADVVQKGERIRDAERLQAERANAGTSLRAQLGLADYIAKRSVDSEITFRQHLRAISGAIEE